MVGNELAQFPPVRLMKFAGSSLFAVLLVTSPVLLDAGELPSQGRSNVPPVLPSDQEITARINQRGRQRLENLRNYSVIRTYKLHNSRLNDDAVMTVRLNYRRGAGKSFEVLETRNAEGMGRRVLQRLIDTEARTSRKESHDRLEITGANYSFHVSGVAEVDGRRCYVVTLTPKRKSKYLIQGKAWVDATDFAMVRWEGRPAASLSFWVGKPYIVQDFQKVGAFWMPSRNHSESSSFLLGSSVLAIDYSDYEVNCSDTRLAELTNAPAAAPVE